VPVKLIKKNTSRVFKKNTVFNKKPLQKTPQARNNPAFFGVRGAGRPGQAGQAGQGAGSYSMQTPNHHGHRNVNASSTIVTKKQKTSGKNEKIRK